MRNPKTLIQHEFIGLKCSVVKAENSSMEGIHGKVIDETMKMIVIQTNYARKQIPKKGTVFRFLLDKTAVDVSGDMIMTRPEDRIKKRLKRW